METRKAKPDSIRVERIVPRTIRFGIRSTSPMIQHAWSDKAKRLLRMTKAERKKQPQVARDPETEAASATYRTKDGKPGIPILAFKTALISAAHKDTGLEKTVVRKSFFIRQVDGDPIIPIETDGDPELREDIVRVGMNQTDLRYRPQFNSWRATITAEIDASALSEQDVLTLANRAGFGVGLCEWRPEKGGEYGRFEIDDTVGIEDITGKEVTE